MMKTALMKAEVAALKLIEKGKLTPDRIQKITQKLSGKDIDYFEKVAVPLGKDALKEGTISDKITELLGQLRMANALNGILKIKYPKK